MAVGKILLYITMNIDREQIQLI